MNHDPALMPMLRKLRLWVNLDAADEQALLDLPHTVATVERNKAVVREGDRVLSNPGDLLRPAAAFSLGQERRTSAHSPGLTRNCSIRPLAPGS